MSCDHPLPSSTDVRRKLCGSCFAALYFAALDRCQHHPRCLASPVRRSKCYKALDNALVRSDRNEARLQQRIVARSQRRRSATRAQSAARGVNREARLPAGFSTSRPDVRSMAANAVSS